MPTLVTRPIRRPPNRRRTIRLALAILGALLVHLLVILAVIWIVPHWPRGHHRVRSHPIQLTMLPPTAAPEPSGPANGKLTPPPYIRTPDDNISDKAPDDPAFISSDNSLAASQNPTDGNKPLPSQAGKDIPTFDFEPRPYRLGTKAADAATSAPSAPDSPQAPVSTPVPTPPPENKKPQPLAKSRPHKPTTQPTPATGDIAMAKAEASPSPDAPVPTPTETPKDEENAPPPPVRRRGSQSQLPPTNPSDVASTGAPKPPGYQPQSIPSKMSGNINNRGKSAVAAIGTPLGRYEKAVSDAIGMRWYMYAEEKADVVSTGTVKIHFYVDREGKIKDVRFTSGNANGALGAVSLEAVTEAELEPIPADVAATLDSGQLEVEYSFSYY